DQRLVLAALRQALTWWARINHPSAAVPEPYFVEPENLRRDRAERDEILARANPRLVFTKSYYAKHFGLEDDDVEIAEPAASPVALAEAPLGGTGFQPSRTGFQPVGQARGLSHLAAPAPTQDIQDALDGLVAAALEAAGLPELLGPVSEAIEKADDLEDLGNRLAAVLAGLAPETFQEVLEQCIFVADLAGRAGTRAEAAEAEES
ncbi:MAG: DUF935 family protein, partial [Thermodesulfobacteriota bacterium]